MKTMK